MELFQIIYTSTPVKQLSEEEMTKLLQLSREANTRFQITGMLLCLPDSYTQLIEGPRQQIAQLYDNIMRDKRHWRVTTLREGRVSYRSFSEWAMAFEKRDSVAGEPGLVSLHDTKVLQLFNILET